MNNLRGAYLLCLFAMIMVWAGYALSLGHNGTIIMSVFTLGGVIAGYIYGKKQKET